MKKHIITKKQVITFIIGLLVGAIIATGGFFAYSKISAKNHAGNMPSSSDSSQPPQMPGGDSSNGDSSQQPPEKPDGDNQNGGAPNGNSNNDSNSNSSGSQSNNNSQSNSSSQSSSTTTA